MLMLLVATAAAALTPHEPTVSVLPGGAIQIAAPAADGGGFFLLQSTFQHQSPRWSGANGPVVHTLGRAATNASDWSVAVDSSRAASGVWSVSAVGSAFSVERTVRLTGGRLLFNDTITATSSAHPSLQILPVGTLLGLQVQHVLQFPAGSNVTEAIVAGNLFFDGGAGACTNADNVDEFGTHRGSFGNPSIFASTSTAGVGLVPLDDVFETHAHSYQRALRRIPSQPLHYKGRTFADCPVSDPPELEISDPMLGLRAGGSYTQEFALYTLLGAECEGGMADYFCFINRLRSDIRAEAGAPKTQLVNSTSYMFLNSKDNPIAKMGGNEEYQWGLQNYSMPWESWSNETLASVLEFQGFGWCEKNAFFEPFLHFYTNAIILPRQARDNHSKS
jgi:hypothetical protein